MSKFTRSWTLFCLSFGIVRNHKRLLLFPMLGGLFALVVALFFLAPLVLWRTGHSCFESGHWGAVAALFGIHEGNVSPTTLVYSSFAYGYMIAIYLTSMFLATFFNVAFYNEILQALNGNCVSLGRGLRFAFSRWQAVLAWSLLSGVVGVVIRFMEERMSLVGRWVVGLVGVTWSVASIFVVPVIIREGQTINPLKFLRSSARMLKKTWGETGIAYIGIGVGGVLLLLGSIILLGVAVGIGIVLNNFWIIGGVGAVWLLGMMAVGYVVGVAGNVFKGALFIYASEGVIPAPFDKQMLDMAWNINLGRKSPGKHSGEIKTESRTQWYKYAKNIIMITIPIIIAVGIWGAIEQKPINNFLMLFVKNAAPGFIQPISEPENMMSSDGGRWTNLMAGVNGIVNALAIDANGNLYVGGTSTDGIAKWDGSSWTKLGAVVNDIVNALATDANGNLYVGGMSTNGIAKWDGKFWANLGAGVDGIVNALAVDTNGNIYAGGKFTTAGVASDISKWNGSSWSSLGKGIPGDVQALAIGPNGNLYAGGSFTNLGGISANRIAMWDGSSWTNLDAGVTSYNNPNYLGNTVSALAVDSNGNLYAGGLFSIAGGVSANRIAKWDGSSWTNLGAGITFAVHALAIDANGNLYAAAGGVSANRITKWDGSSWIDLNIGMNDTVSALAVDSKGNLYAGGSFYKAGEVRANNVAKWIFGK